MAVVLDNMEGLLHPEHLEVGGGLDEEDVEGATGIK